MNKYELEPWASTNSGPYKCEICNKEMNKAKLVGMICKERLQTLEESHPFFGIKKVLTPYSF